jgi:uncharacterized membrane protein
MLENHSSSEPTAEQVLAEAKRRMEERPATTEERPAGKRMSPGARRAVVAVDRFIFWFAKHWLTVFNTLAFLYVGLPFLAPILMYLGAEGAATALYRIYGPLCHQYPQRSWYLFGSQPAYSIEQLKALFPLKSLYGGTYRAASLIGYQVAFCQRDTAIYGTILLAGLLYGFVRRWLRPFPIWAYFLIGLVPIGLDGGLQLFFPGLESNPVRRVITGALFGLATVWFAYPYIEESAVEVLETLEQRFGWKK